MKRLPSAHWTIYVDGSCLGNQNVDATTPAAWSVVVITGDTGLGRGSGSLVEEFAGPVVTLRWLLSEGGGEEAIIRADSQYAGNLACGAWRAKANKTLVAHVQELWRTVAAIRPLSWEHVKAHRGHRWNERADHLALRKANDEPPIPLSFWKPGQR